MRKLLWLPALLLSLPSPAADWLYLTVPGDTLIGIGRQYLKNPDDWPRIQSVNQVPLPRLLPANTRIRIPVSLLKVTPAPVSVTHIQGNVRLRGADGKFRPLAVGDHLRGGETVLTGPGSFATFRLADGTTLNQQPGSRLEFGRLAVYGKTGMVATELNLQGGRLEANASKQLAPAGGLNVRTPVAVAGLRGTRFRLNVGDDGQSLRQEVLEGEVAVTARNREVRVGAGQGTLVRAGQAPAAPRPLLPAPSAAGLPDTVRELPLAFTWTAEPGARAWRAQLSAGTEFQAPLWEALTPEPRASWDAMLPDGRYVLRLRALDQDGLEGLERDHPFELDARPLPPTPEHPQDGARSTQERTALRWSASDEARGYLLQLSPSPEFDHDLVERRLETVIQHPENLAPGIWHWRIASLDEHGERHGWSAIHAFRVQPLPTPPAGEARTEADKVSFRWPAVSGAARYELEIHPRAGAGTDAPPHWRGETRDTGLALSLAPGQYAWRLRALEPDGQAGAWGAFNPLILPPAPPADLTAQVEKRTLQAQWQGNAPGYRLELAADADFRIPVNQQTVSATTAQLPRPMGGRYWLRVVALGGDGVESPPSPAVTLDVPHYPWWWWPVLLLPFGI